MEITATTDIDSKTSWSAIKKHTEHDPKLNHTNQDIDVTERHFNRSGKLANVDRILKQHYGATLKEHDERVIKQNHLKRAYGSVKAMLDSKHGHYDERLVATFGSKDSVTQLHDAVYQSKPDDMSNRDFESKWKRGLSRGLASYAKGFNKRNKCLTMTEYQTNVDELGAPHVHAQVIPRGHTKSGKASSSFDRALFEQLGITDNREAMKQWRAKEDTAVVSNVDRALSQELGDTYKRAISHVGELKLYRTGNKHSMPMAEYKAIKRIEDQHQDLIQSNRQLKAENKRLTDINNGLQGDLADRETAVATGEADNDAMFNIIDSREAGLDSREQAVTKREKEAEDKMTEAENLHSSVVDVIESGLRVFHGPFINHDKPGNPDITRSIADPQGNWSIDHKKGLPLLLDLFKQATEDGLKAFKALLEKKQEQQRQEQEQKERDRRRQEQEDQDQRPEPGDDDGPEL